jgi:predicted nucleotidyltransferase component of viral defense system
MISTRYNAQVALLLRILPEIARENDVALHGGSGINLFYNEMPRLSVDIDLTYLPFGSRSSDLRNIKALLVRLHKRLLSIIPGIEIRGPGVQADEYKLYCTLGKATVKIEINTINRGVYRKTEIRPLCVAAQEQFNMFCEIQVVPIGQLYGGKIVAALDRQHPRDLFDVKKMLETIGYAEEVNEGFIFCLLSSKRPIHELLQPSLLDHRSTLESQFAGMTDENFTWEIYESTRLNLIDTVHKNLATEICELLFSFADGKPSWGQYDFGGFPAIQWKLQNIMKLKKQNPSKHEMQMDELKNRLNK